jgi:hypothetical protein
MVGFIIVDHKLAFAMTHELSCLESFINYENLETTMHSVELREIVSHFHFSLS